VTEEVTEEVTEHDSAEILRVAEQAAREAGELLLDYHGRIDPGQIATKSSVRDLVTEADVQSERLLVDRLRTAFPGHAIESEEEVRDDPSDGTGPGGEARWFLDPLDGTVNFVHGLPVFAVSMGLFVDGRPEVAVVHMPRLGETFTAIRERGAFLNGAPISVSTATELESSLLATGFPYRRGELEHDNRENFNRFFYDVRGLRRMGSAATDLAFIAAGRYDGYWELHLSPHDVAAGALLVREAGGIVTDADGGEDWLRGGHIVASTPGIHEAIRSRLEH
jgi:myo-inositol-1(or 4)-monophosphatase